MWPPLGVDGHQGEGYAEALLDVALAQAIQQRGGETRRAGGRHGTSWTNRVTGAPPGGAGGDGLGSRDANLPPRRGLVLALHTGWPIHVGSTVGGPAKDKVMGNLGWWLVVVAAVMFSMAG